MQSRESEAGTRLVQVFEELLRTCLGRLSQGDQDGAPSGSGTETAAAGEINQASTETAAAGEINQASTESQAPGALSAHRPPPETRDERSQCSVSGEASAHQHGSSLPRRGGIAALSRQQPQQDLQPPGSAGFWRALLEEEPWPEELADQHQGPSGAQGVPAYPLYKRLAAVFSLPEAPPEGAFPGCTFDQAWASCQAQEPAAAGGGPGSQQEEACSEGWQERGSGTTGLSAEEGQKPHGVPQSADGITTQDPAAGEDRRSPSSSSWSETVSTVWGTLKQLQQAIQGVKLELHVEGGFLASLSQGRKTVEGRCCDPKYQALALGDGLLFNRRLLLQVHSMRPYPSFRALLAAEGLQRVLPGAPSVEEGVAVYRRFYPQEREGKQGVLAIQLQGPPPALFAAGAGTPRTFPVQHPSETPSEDGMRCSIESPTLLGCVESVLLSLGPLGVCRLLGMAVTRGSVPGSLPPPRSALVRSFQELHGGATPARGHSRDTTKSQMGSTGVGKVSGSAAGSTAGGEVKREGPASGPRETSASTSGCESTIGVAAVTSGRWGDCEEHDAPTSRTRAGDTRGSQGAQPSPSKLTVGAQALAKHSPCDLQGSFWPSLGGSESAKNRTARHCLQRVLDTAVWLNTHCLPGGAATFEVRTREGYGARWAADGSQFWGLLEPPMEGGHEAKWRH